MRLPAAPPQASRIGTSAELPTDARPPRNQESPAGSRRPACPSRPSANGRHLSALGRAGFSPGLCRAAGFPGPTPVQLRISPGYVPHPAERVSRRPMRARSAETAWGRVIRQGRRAGLRAGLLTDCPGRARQGFRKARRRCDRPACASPFFGAAAVQLQTGMPNRVFQQPDTLPLLGPRNATTSPRLRGRGHNAGPALRRGHGRQPPGRSWCARGSLSASLEPQRHSRVALIPGAEPDALAKRILAARAAAWKPPEIPPRANPPP